MIEGGGIDIIGHADKMHYNAMTYRPGLLDEPWYDELVHAYLARIVELGYIVEINTKAYEDTHTFFPNQRYFRYLCQLGARVMVNSDAHYPDRIASGRSQALRQLSSAGFHLVTEWVGSSWCQVHLA